MATDCLFCKIAGGSIPAQIVFQNDEIVAFRDIQPAAPTHILIIPRQHIASAAAITDEHSALLGRLIKVAADLARSEQIESGGYRLVTNTGANAGQSVP